MAGEQLKTFMMGLGFQLDTAGMAKLEAFVKNTEAYAKQSAANIDRLVKTLEGYTKGLSRTTSEADKHKQSQEKQSQAAKEFCKQIEECVKGLTKSVGELGRHREEQDKNTKSTDHATDSLRRHGAQHHVMRETWKLSKEAVLGFVGALSALAVTGEEAVRRVSREFSNLYYMAQRTGVSAKGIETLRFQFEKIGLSAEQADSAIGGLASRMRSQPGLITQISGWVGPIKNAGDAILKLGKEYAKVIAVHGEFSAGEAQFRSVLESMGMDPDQILQVAKNIGVVSSASVRFKEIIKQLFKGDGEKALEALQEKSVAFQRKWVDFRFVVGKIWEGFAGALMPGMERLLAVFVNSITDIGGGFDTLEDKIKKFLDDTIGVDGKRGEETLKNLWTQIKNVGTEFAKIDFKGLATTLVTVTDAVIALVAALSRFKYDPNKTIRENAIITPGKEGKSILDKGASFSDTGPGLLLDWLFGSGEKAPEDPRVGHAAGGIVGINAHAGEAVLPVSLTNMLLRAANQNQLQPFNAARGQDNLTDIIERLANDFSQWWSGSASFNPIVQLASDFYDKISVLLHQLLEDFGFEQKSAGAAGAAAGGESRGQVGGGGSSGGSGMPGRSGGGRVSPGGGGGGGEITVPQAAAEAISQAEGTWKGGKINYDEVLGAGKYGKPEDWGRKVPLSQMTLSEVIKFGKEVLRPAHGKATGLPWERTSSASGGFQITGSNIEALAKQFNLDPDKTKFDEQTQLRMMAEIYRTQGTNAWEGFKAHPELRARAEQLAKSGAMTPAGGDVPAGPGGARVETRGNERNVNPLLVQTMKEGFAATLPENYSAYLSSGERIQDKGSGAHGEGAATDWQIRGPRGEKIADRGLHDPKAVALYRNAMVEAIARMYVLNPKLAKTAAVGSHFGTQRHGGGGPADLMHIDVGYKGPRGHYGDNMSEHRDALKRAEELRKAGYGTPAWREPGRGEPATPTPTPVVATPVAATRAASTAASALTQKQQYDADIAAGRRPIFPPGTKFNARGEAISGDLSKTLPGQRTDANISPATIKSFAQANATKTQTPAAKEEQSASPAELQAFYAALRNKETTGGQFDEWLTTYRAKPSGGAPGAEIINTISPFLKDLVDKVKQFGDKASSYADPNRDLNLKGNLGSEKPAWRRERTDADNGDYGGGSDKQVVYKSENTINVVGAADPHGTGRAVRDLQDRHSPLQKRGRQTNFV